MELRHLASFLAVVEEGQFARAAARLFLSPPAVTGHVRQLERELGVPLLERSPLRLTEAGERLVPHARAALAAANAAADAVADLRDDAPPTGLRVGIMVHGSAELTPAILRAFRRARPETPVTVVSLDFTEHATALVERRVDVAFLRPAPDDERLVSDPMTTEPRIITVPDRGPFADAGALRMADVVDEPFLGLPDGVSRAFADYLYFSAGRNGEAPRLNPEGVRTPQDVLTGTAAGRGLSSGLYSFVRFYSWPGVRFVPLLDAPWEQSVLAARRDDTRLEVRAFRSLAVALARDLGPVLVPPPPLPRP
ncbi:LysR family transcriptional regulator [Actinomadura harenae]|uniref:LysR family transcriptional regulator n=1 Tax=Actinomadura harenae TaxID=2483351 RepID=A0A3M2M8P4_9ACTN|nr:LysR family transcriptional regulator [Actinomadura harenae]RMI45360.1 LysR family transcriptional regulator [Actinomadura harenae]